MLSPVNAVGKALAGNPSKGNSVAPDSEGGYTRPFDKGRNLFRMADPQPGSQPELYRGLKARALYAVGYGDVGSSIYYALGVTTLWALGAAPLAIGIAGLFFACTVLTYSEMSAALPQSGGTSNFARRAFNEAVSFLAGWGLLLDYVITMTISARSVAPYLGVFFNAFNPAVVGPERFNTNVVIFTLAVLLLLLALNVLGIRQSTSVSLTLCSIDILTQLTIITVGSLVLLNLPKVVSGIVNIGHPTLGLPQAEQMHPTLGQFVHGITVAMVAYTGIDAASQLSAEARTPGKTVPRALLSIMGSVLVLYAGLSVVALSAMHPHELATTWKDDPLAGVVYNIAGRAPGAVFLRYLVGFLGATILFVAANAGMIGASRLAYAMALHRQLPPLFGRVHPRLRTPYVSLLVFAAAAGVVAALVRRLEHLADMYNFGSMLCFTIAHLSLIALRMKEPNLARPFRLRGNVRIRGAQIPISALIGVCATASVWLVIVFTHPAGRNMGFLWLAAGGTMYVLYRRAQQLSLLRPVPVAAPVAVHLPPLRPRILVPIAGGPLSMQTVDLACRMANDLNAPLSCIHVWEIPTGMSVDTPMPEHVKRYGQQALDSAGEIAKKYKVEMSTDILQARRAGPAIVDQAEELGVETVVLGATRRSRVAERLFGSTTGYVLGNARCQVVVFSPRVVEEPPTPGVTSPSGSEVKGSP